MSEIIPIYIPTYISNQSYAATKVLPRLLFYNGQVDCEKFYVHDENNSSRGVNQFPYFDNYNVVNGNFPTVNSKSLLFYNEESVYGQTPTNTLYSDYWEKYVQLLYNPRTKLLNASAIIPLANYFKISQNDIIEFRGNYYHLRAINDYNLSNGECSIQLLGPILPDALPFIIPAPTTSTTTTSTTTTTINPNLYPMCLGYDPTDCSIACYSYCECNPPCPTFQFSSTSVSDLIFTINAVPPYVDNFPTYTFTLPTNNNRYYSCSVDWGDGTTSIISGSNSANINHTYATGSYTASISGLYQSFDCNTANNGGPSARAVINGVQQFGNTGATKVNFGRTVQKINMDMVYGQPGQFTWTDAGSLFSGVAGGGKAPNNTIKEDLLYYCTNVRSFISIFQANSKIDSLPENMFNRCYEGSLFGSAFSAANRDGLISGSFTTFPSGSGFFTSGSYTGFYNMGAIFYQYRNPGYLYSSSFDNIITAKNSKYNGYMYANRLFAATSTSPITGQAPAIWVIPPGGIEPSGVDAFLNCTNLSNYADIPAGFK
jgi:hypothetical protein